MKKNILQFSYITTFLILSNLFVSDLYASNLNENYQNNLIKNSIAQTKPVLTEEQLIELGNKMFLQQIEEQNKQKEIEKLNVEEKQHKTENNNNENKVIQLTNQNSIQKDSNKKIPDFVVHEPIDYGINEVPEEENNTSIENKEDPFLANDIKINEENNNDISLEKDNQTEIREKLVTQFNLNTDFDPNLLENILNEEVRRLKNSIDAFNIVLLDINNPTYRRFISMGILKMTDNQFSRHSHGLSGMLAKSGNEQVCYILLDKTKGRNLWDMFIKPMSLNNHPSTGAAWITGHEAGHCLDQLDRVKYMNNRLSWNVNNSKVIGIHPRAIVDTYNKDLFAKAAYYQDPRKLLENPVQQQFAERAADIFATFWVSKLGANDNFIDVIKNERARLNPASPHFTAPVYDKIREKLKDTNNMNNLYDIWMETRNLQYSIGVSQEVLRINRNEVSQILKNDDPTPRIEKWEVTSRGPVPIDQYGNRFIQEKTQQERPAIRNFNQLKRFGSGN